MAIVLGYSAPGGAYFNGSPPLLGYIDEAGYAAGYVAASLRGRFSRFIRYNESVAALRRIPIFLEDVTGAPVLGEVVTGAEIQISKGGAPFINGGGVVASTPGEGGYYYEPLQSETATHSFLMIKVVAGGLVRPYVHAVDIGIRIVKDEQSASRRRIPIYLKDFAGDPVPGLSIVGAFRKVSKNGTVFVNGSGAVVEIGSGAYYYELALSETDTAGFGLINIIKPPAVPVTYSWDVVTSPVSVTYRMRARDTTLVAVVYWSATQIDDTGAYYTGPGPLVDIVVQNAIGSQQ